MAPTEKEILQARLILAQADNNTKKAKSKPLKTPGKENKTALKAKKEPAKPGEKAKKRPAAIHWSKKAFHHLTDLLLNRIEENARYRQAFGFSKDPSTTVVKTGGETVADLYTKLARDVLVTPKDSHYTEEDLPHLQKVVSNRVNALKQGYREQRDILGSTGQGLIEEDREGEITAGSELANKWDEVQHKFPWYKQMNNLFGSNPVVHRAAVANSQTPIDMTVLEPRGRAFTPTFDVKEDILSFSDDDCGDSKLSGASSDLDGDGDNDDDKSDDLKGSIASSPLRELRLLKNPQTPAPLAKSRTSVATPTTAVLGTKRKAMHDQIYDMASEDRVQRVKIIEIKEREKSRRSKTKATVKADLELSRMKYQADEAAKQRAHEVQMMERQMNFQMQFGMPPQFQPHGPPGAFGGPGPQAFPIPAHPAIDPALNYPPN